MTLKLLAIGGLGTMLGPSAKHLTKSTEATFLRVHDRGKKDPLRDQYRAAWREHGAALVPTLKELVGDGHFDGIVICAGKNGDDYKILLELMPLLTAFKRPYFIFHMSTLSCHFVSETFNFCKQHGIDYVNYPVTGGASGAAAGTMLVLASGKKELYERLEPMLKKIGVPKYFDEKITRGAAVKLIGHVMVFYGLLGMSSAILLQKNIFGDTKLGSSQIDFFDFLNSGAGGIKQWDVTLRRAIKENDWDTGFLLQHAAVDIIYTIDLMLSQNMPLSLTLPLCEISLLFSYIMKKSTAQHLATQAILELLATTPKKEIDVFITQNLSLETSFENCIKALPQQLQDILMLQVQYPLY